VVPLANKWTAVVSGCC